MVLRVLLVEDDALLGDGLRAGLAQGGDQVTWVRDGVAALRAVAASGFDCVVLDLGLPGFSGLEVLTRLRKQGHALPVLVLTARDGVEDRVRGLDLGADDYVIKPADLTELRARLRALVRRWRGETTEALTLGPLTLDPAARVVTLRGEPVKVSPSAFFLLKEFMEQPDRVLSRERLERCLYGRSAEVNSNTVEVHIHHLRKALGDDVIRTVRGVGYLMPGRGP